MPGHSLPWQHLWSTLFPFRGLSSRPAHPRTSRSQGKTLQNSVRDTTPAPSGAPHLVNTEITRGGGSACPPASPSPPARCPARSPAAPPPRGLTVRLLSLLCRRGAAGDPGVCGDKRGAPSRPLSEPSMAGAGRALRGPHGPAARLGSARLGWGKREAAPPPGRAASPRSRQPARPMASRAGPGRAAEPAPRQARRGGPPAPPPAGRPTPRGGPGPALRLSPPPRRAVVGGCGGRAAWPGNGGRAPAWLRSCPGRPRVAGAEAAGAGPQRASPLLAAAAGLCRGLGPRLPLPRHRVPGGRCGDEQGRWRGAGAARPTRAAPTLLGSSLGCGTRPPPHRQPRPAAAARGSRPGCAAAPPRPLRAAGRAARSCSLGSRKQGLAPRPAQHSAALFPLVAFPPLTCFQEMRLSSPGGACQRLSARWLLPRSQHPGERPGAAERQESSWGWPRTGQRERVRPSV